MPAILLPKVPFWHKTIPFLYNSLDKIESFGENNKKTLDKLNIYNYTPVQRERGGVRDYLQAQSLRRFLLKEKHISRKNYF